MHHPVQQNGAESDAYAGVGVLFQPVTSRARFQFRPLVLWNSWVSISADAPPIAPPYPAATAFSVATVRMLAQSWRTVDGSDFRTDADRTVELVNYFTWTPNRVWAQDDAGVATPDT